MEKIIVEQPDVSVFSPVKLGLNKKFNLTIEEKGVLGGKCFVVKWDRCIGIKGKFRRNGVLVLRQSFN